MSDLAPFVAAVLRDPVVEGLRTELQQEKEANSNLKSIEIVLVPNDDDEISGPEFVVFKGRIPDGSYDNRGGMYGNTGWTVPMSTHQNALPPTLTALQRLKVKFGAGWITEMLFGSYADPHVAPAQYDAESQTGHFEIYLLGTNRVQLIGLAMHPISCINQFHDVVGQLPGSLFSRLVEWVNQQQESGADLQVWIDKVSMDVNESRHVLDSFNIPRPPSVRRLYALYDESGIHRAVMQAWTQQSMRRAEASQAQAQQAMAQAQQMMQAYLNDG